MFPNKLVEVMFRAYCKERNMNPDDWPTIGIEKQNAWLAAANAARELVRPSTHVLGIAGEIIRTGSTSSLSRADGLVLAQAVIDACRVHG